MKLVNRRELLIGGTVFAAYPYLGGAQHLGGAQQEGSPAPAPSEAPGSPPTILLSEYLPQSIYRIPITEVTKAKFPIIDAHCHGHGPLSVSEMVAIMDKVGVEKTVIFTGASTPDRFAERARDYADHPDRFDLWCGFDLRDVEKGSFGPGAVDSLEGCYRAGAKGIGELSDKGRGFSPPRPPSAARRPANAFGGLNGGATYTRNPMPPNPNAPIGPHPDDARLDSLWDKAGQLGMPVSIHVSDPIWSYQAMDNTNDGLMNGWTWRIVLEPGMYDHNQLINSLGNIAAKHPKTQFIACHYSNLDYDLNRLGEMFDRNPNLNADLSARFAENSNDTPVHASVSGEIFRSDCLWN